VDDIRLVYIGSAHRAVHYAVDHLPEPKPRPDQILAVTEPRDVEGLILPPWCHIATELHTTADGTRAALEGHAIVFEAALARRRRLGKAGA
jgi:hypothetical protein